MPRTPTPEETLSNLYLVKRDCLKMRALAEARGDLKEVRAFEQRVEEIKMQIAVMGGDPDG